MQLCIVLLFGLFAGLMSEEAAMWSTFTLPPPLQLFENQRPVVLVLRDPSAIPDFCNLFKGVLSTSQDILMEYTFLVLASEKVVNVLLYDMKHHWLLNIPQLRLITIRHDALPPQRAKYEYDFHAAMYFMLSNKLQWNITRFVYIDSATRITGSLSSIWDAFQYHRDLFWLAAPVQASPPRLAPNHCVHMIYMINEAYSYLREACHLSLHLVLVDITDAAPENNTREMINISGTSEATVTRKYNTGIFFYPELESMQRRWVDDIRAFAILPCQWSTYEGCPPSASGAMHPDVTPSARYLAYESYLNSISDNEMKLMRSQGESFQQCLHPVYYGAIANLLAEYVGDEPLYNFISVIESPFHDLPAGVVVDVGASVGTFIERIGVMDHFEYHLFEPSPPHYSILEQKYSNYSNIHINTKALSHANHSGTQAFFFNPDEATTGRLLSKQVLFGGKARNEIYEINVPVTTLDDHFFENSLRISGLPLKPYEITLLKTDTEGYDTLILLGGENTLKKTGMVIFECHVLENMEEGGPGTTHYQASIYLEKLGFRVFKIGKNSLLEFGSGMYHPLIDINKGWSNCLALKRGHPWEQRIFNAYAMINCALAGA